MSKGTSDRTQVRRSPLESSAAPSTGSLKIQALDIIDNFLHDPQQAFPASKYEFLLKNLDVAFKK